jgi:hypothetical protein
MSTAGTPVVHYHADAQRHVLSAALQSAEARALVLARLPDESLYGEVDRRLLRTMRELEGKGRCSLVTVAAALPDLRDEVYAIHDLQATISDVSLSIDVVAADYAKRALEGRLSAAQAALARANGDLSGVSTMLHDAAVLAGEAEAFGAAASQDGSPDDKQLWLAPMSATEWAASTPERPDYVLEPWCVRGFITDVVGREKGGKSTFVAGACAALSQGRPFLGYECEAAPLLYLYEGNAQAWRYLMNDAGLLECKYLYAHLWPMLPPGVRALDWSETCEWIGELAKKLRAGVVVLDIVPTWARLSADAENDPGVARTTMETLRLSAQAYDFAAWTLRHTRKGHGEDHIDESRGTGAWIGAVDISLGLRRPTEGLITPTRRILSSIGRAPLPGDLAIEFDKTAHSFTNVGPLENMEKRDMRRWLLESLPEGLKEAIKGGWTKTHTRERASEAGYAERRVSSCLAGLVAEGVVGTAEDPTPRSGKKPHYYFLRGENGLF